MSLADLMNRIAVLEAKLAQTVRVCEVASVQDAKGTVRVKLPDSGNMLSGPLPVLVRKVQDDQDYWLPDVGEQVVCLFLPIGLEQGFVLGAFYQSVDGVPVADRNKRHIAMKDGGFVEYDRSSGKLTVEVKGDVNWSVGGDMLLDVDGSLTLKGNPIYEN